jgi:hypothetical protein
MKKIIELACESCEGSVCFGCEEQVKAGHHLLGLEGEPVSYATCGDDSCNEKICNMLMA